MHEDYSKTGSRFFNYEREIRRPSSSNIHLKWAPGKEEKNENSSDVKEDVSLPTESFH